MAKIVLFALSGQLYGVDALRVRSIERLPKLVSFPGDDSRVLGVANIRGTVMPVVDLAQALRIEEAPSGDCRRLLIVEAGGEEVAFAVETVREVVDVDTDQAAAPHSLAKDGSALVEGVVLRREEILLLLRLDRVLGREEARTLTALAGGTA